MSCDSIQRELLSCGWDLPRRQALAVALAHAESCESCREALEGYDRLQAAFQLPAGDVAPAGGWAAFEERLVRTAVSHPARRWTRVQGFAMAASLLLAVTGWGLYWHAGRQPSGLQQVTPNGAIPAAVSHAAFSQDELAQRIGAFRELSEVFENRTSWVLVSERASDLGLDSAPPGKNGGLLLVRLWVNDGREVLSSADLMIRPGRCAEVAIPGKKGLALRYQIATSAEDPARLQLWVELKAPGRQGGTSCILASDVTAWPGVVTPIGQMVTAGGRYDVSVELVRANLQAKTL